jgi:hypothetical protein
MRDRSLDLRGVLQALTEHYGPLEPLPTNDPFELILWENVAYLAPPVRRRGAFAMLRREVGLSPGDILAASQAALQRVTAHGILKARFADKLRACARIAIEVFGTARRYVNAMRPCAAPPRHPLPFCTLFLLTEDATAKVLQLVIYFLV